MTEVFQTYMPDGKPLDLVPRDIVHREGFWHRSVNVFVFRASDNALLLQRRAMTKDICPGLWDLSVAEHLKPDETYEQAAHRGLQEELAISNVSLTSVGDELKFILEDQKHDVKDYEFQRCFLVVTDKQPKIDKGELSEIKFCMLEDVKNDLRITPEQFTPWFRNIIDHGVL